MYSNPVRDAFLKALTPVLIMVCALLASLAPLYLIGVSQIQQYQKPLLLLEEQISELQ
jgi:hypothetical protein